MTEDLIHALVLLQNWGPDEAVRRSLIADRHVVSLFHVMGRHSYLMDANFDHKEQLSAWITAIKTMTLPSGVPAVISLQTQRIIDVHKRKEDFTLSDYLGMKDRYHFFVKIDAPHHDPSLLRLLIKSPIVHSVLHVQGENTFTIEIIVESYGDYRELLSRMKKFASILHIETQEVVTVLKYRNHALDEGGRVVRGEDIREIFTL